MPRYFLSLPVFSVLTHPFRHLLFEWFTPSFIRGNLAQRFAILLTLPDGLNRVAKLSRNTSTTMYMIK